MNLRIKRCLCGFMTWAAMTGVAVAQQPESEGTVQLGQPPAAINAAPTDTEGTVHLGTSPLEPLPGPMAPLNAGYGQPGPGNNFGYTSVDTVFRPRFNVDSRGGGLYGYNAGYTNIGMFLPYAIEADEAIVFLDARGLVTYDGGGGANVGVGWRWWARDIDRIVGLSAWYDNANGGVGPNFNQIGLSFESLGRYVDYRVNGYIPVGDVNHTGASTVNSTPLFNQSNIVFQRTSAVAQAFTGFDAETGGPLPFLGRYGVNGYVGGYYFSGQGQQGGSFTGVSGRFMSQISEDVSFGVQVTNDHVFGLNTQFQVFVTLPDGVSGQWMRNLRVQDRLTQSVFRQYRVITHTDSIQSYEKAINPKDGLPYFVAQIDPNATGTGNGTIETPFNSISAYNSLSAAQQQQFDMLYVRPQTTGNSNLDTGTGAASTLTLYNGQRLLSTSVAHTFQTTNVPGVDLTLPGFTGGALPALFNGTGGNVVTFAPGNTQCLEVSGFDITGSATGNGIAGTNNQFVSINNNNIHDALNGVLLTNLSGTVAAGTDLRVTDNVFANNINAGFQVTNNATSQLDVTFQRNTFSNNGTDGLRLDANNGSIIGGLIGGVDTAADPGPPVVEQVLRGNTFSGNTGNGIQLTSDAGTLNFQSPPGPTGSGIINNTFSANGGDGLHIVSNSNTATTGFFIDVLSNKFGDPTVAASGNTGYGVSLASDSGTNNFINIGGATTDLGNVFAGNVAGGVLFNLTGTNVTTTNIQNNTISFNSVVAGSTILAGFNANTLAANDDNSTGLVPIGFNADFFGVNFNQVFVNNNGNVTLNAALGAFTPFPIITTGTPMLAPFFADVDTSAGNLVSYGTGTVNGRLAFGVNWPDVRHFLASGAAGGLPTNNFQLVMIDRSDIAAGDFDFQFNYQQIQWEAGTASGGNAQGLYVGPGGGPARAGWSNGTTNSFELAGSGIPGAFLDSGPAATSLIQNSLNSNLLGRYQFSVRGGVVGGGAPGTVNGIEINVADTAHLQTSDISSNTATGLGGFGLQVNTSGSGKVDNLTVANNTFTQNDGGIQFNRTDTSTLQATLQTNVLNQNTFYGLSVNGSGSNINASGLVGDGINLAVSDTSANNSGVNGLQVTSSGGALVNISSNRDNYSVSAGDNINVVTNDTSVTTLNFLNVLADGSTSANGFSATTNGSSILNLGVDSPTDPLFTAGTRSSFSNNILNGMLFTTNGSSLVQTINNGINDVAIDDNLQNGVLFNRSGASITQVGISNSSISTNTLDGFRYNASNSAPGSPSLITLQSDVLTGNVNGVHFDLSSSAQVSADIIESTISNNSNDGILVTTVNASAFGDPINGTASRFLGNTINNNAGPAGIQLVAQDVSFQNVFIGASAAGTRTTLTGNVDGILITDTSTGAVPAIPGPSNNTYTIVQTDIIDSTQNGIDLSQSGAATTVNIGYNPAAAVTYLATGARNDVVITRTTAVPGGQHGINANATSGTNTLNIVNTTIEYALLNGVNVDQTGGDLDFNMQATDSRFNAQRGLNVLVVQGSNDANYNVGGVNTNEGNDLSYNQQQGFVFGTLATTSSSFLQDRGVNNSGAINNNNLRSDRNSNDNVTANLNVVGNMIQNNGTVGSVNSDGLVLSVGSNTRQNVVIAGNTFGGNVLDDVRIFPVASVNPPNSIDNPTTAPPTNAPHDLLQLDPTAHLDLAFGSISSTYDSDLSSGTFSLFPGDSPNRILGNTGEQINVTDNGSAATAAITSSGVFTNADPFKGAGRSVVLDAEVYAYQYSEVTAAASSSSFTGQAAGLNLDDPLSPYNNDYNSQSLEFRTGALTGETQTVLSYGGGAGGFTTTAFTGTPAVTDIFRLHTLDANGFVQLGVSQDVENAFSNAGVNGGFLLQRFQPFPNPNPPPFTLTPNAP